MQAKTYVADRILTSRSIVEYLEDRGLAAEQGIRGRRLFCCPLHNEDTPSFIVYPADGDRNTYESYYCYGCQKGGNLISLKVALEGVSPSQAISDMAEGLGIKVDDQIAYVIDQIDRSTQAASKLTEDIEDCLLIVSRAVYHHLRIVGWDDLELFRCDLALRALDSAAERRDRDKVFEITETLPDLLGRRKQAFMEERERQNADAAKFYAKL